MIDFNARSIDAWTVNDRQSPTVVGPGKDFSEKKGHQRLKCCNSETKRDVPTGKMVIDHNCTFTSKAAYWDLAGQSLQHKIGVLLVPRFEGTKSFAPSPQKTFWPKNGRLKKQSKRVAKILS